MITLNFYKNGVYIVGHDTLEICSVISFAMWNCIEDCLDIGDDVDHYMSGNDVNWKDLGFTYLKVDENNLEHVKIINKFKNRISIWIEYELDNKALVNDFGEELINWESALNDAKTRYKQCELLN